MPRQLLRRSRRSTPSKGEARKFKYITSPEKGEIGVEKLRVLAREEEELQAMS
jgi:hypothetical protein